MSDNLQRKFASRDELVAYVQTQFPNAAKRSDANGNDSQSDHRISAIIGGRQAAEIALNKVHPGRYAKSRNFFTGAVTRLSPYIRYGVLSLAEIRKYVMSRVQNPDEATKLINELAWRDYWQRLYVKLGDDIWKDNEPYKTGYTASDYQETLPDDISSGTTNLVCIDSFSRDLQETGYLHNHGRMWLSAYMIHWRKIRWQVGAKWFLEHLLDGDPASNNMSWQWVASTFSQKPYYFNRENLERYTEGVYCRQCPVYGHCDFEGSYEKLEQKLFPQAEFHHNGGGDRYKKSKKQRR